MDASLAQGPSAARIAQCFIVIACIPISIATNVVVSQANTVLNVFPGITGVEHLIENVFRAALHILELIALILSVNQARQKPFYPIVQNAIKKRLLVQPARVTIICVKTTSVSLVPMDERALIARVSSAMV